MKVEKIRHPLLNRTSFRVYHDGLPVKHINKFLSNLDKCDYAPNTVKAYAHDLVQYSRFLKYSNLNWKDACIDTIIDFIFHFKHRLSDDLSVVPTEHLQARTLTTINRSLASISSFYRFNIDARVINPTPALETLTEKSKNAQKEDFMSFAKASRPLSIKRQMKPLRRQPVSKKRIKTVNEDIQTELINFCSNARDRLLVVLLIETGLRVGQALQLRHSDIVSWESKICIHPRLDNPNEVYAKSKVPYEVVISDRWSHMYTDFLIHDLDEVESDYVFTKLYRKDGGCPSEPLSYQSVKDLFQRFSRHRSVQVSPHMLRHSFATEQLRHKVPIEIVSKALGHRSINTTKHIYEHLTAEDMKNILFSRNKDTKQR